MAEAARTKMPGTHANVQKALEATTARKRTSASMMIRVNMVEPVRI
jgi:hypothetical protein